MPSPDLPEISKQVEQLLVMRNLRGMQTVYAHQRPGTCLRAATRLLQSRGPVGIGTGFPVGNTFETDGPPAAAALGRVLERCGKTVVMLCEKNLFPVFRPEFHCRELTRGTQSGPEEFGCLISIECPGKNTGDRCVNFRGEDITASSPPFDSVYRAARCPKVAVGDGGNEIGMGNLRAPLAQLHLSPCITPCDELVLADVSNWGGYGIIALISLLRETDFLAGLDPERELKRLNLLGAVDGVTGNATPTEDGLEAAEGIRLIGRLREICGFV